jgi:hypothetical protein
MTKNQNLHWTPHLGDVERALNATHNSTTGTSADRLWSVEKQAVNDPDKLKSQMRQQDRAVRLIDKFNALQFKTVDFVRILMSSIFSNIRKKVKQNDTKHQAVKGRRRYSKSKRNNRRGNMNDQGIPSLMKMDVQPKRGRMGRSRSTRTNCCW